MANSTTHSDNTRSSTGPGVEMRWPAAVLWRTDEPTVRKITTTDVWEALAQGFDDFRAIPTHAFFICLIYPVAGLVLYRLSFGYEMLPLLYPLVAGFALLGPFIAIGLYELSRRREQDPNVSPMRAFDVMHRLIWSDLPSRPVARNHIRRVALRGQPHLPTNFRQRRAASGRVHQPGDDNRKRHAAHHRRQRCGIFVCGVRACDQRRLVPDARRRNVSAATAVRTSVRAAIENPIPIALWGLIVAFSLLIGAVPLLVGLALVLPVLGHATWHLYRNSSLNKERVLLQRTTSLTLCRARLNMTPAIERKNKGPLGTRKKNTSRPVSRVLSGVVPPRRPFIWDACCQAPHAINPGGRHERACVPRFPRSAAPPIRSCSRWGLPCHVCYQTRGALLPHLFTLTSGEP